MFTGPNKVTDGLVLTMDAFNYKSYKRDYNILDTSTWSLGSGSVSGFGLNGYAEENHRVIDTDPWGNEIIVWEARPDELSNSDGGWNTSRFNIDNTKMYRFSVWIRRTVDGVGNYYLGLNRTGSTETAEVGHRANGNPQHNPYFRVSSTPNVGLGEWILIVGHVHPVGSGIGDMHQDSGEYSVNSGRVGNINGDFTWLEGTTTSFHRTYLYYSTDVNVRQQFCYPRVDICDGTEPTIDELLNAKLHRWKDLYGKNQLDVVDAIWRPEGYFSFRGNGTNDGVIKGDHIAGFGGIADTRLYSQGMTISWWMRVGENPASRQSLFWGSGTIRHIELYNVHTTSPNFLTEAATTNGYRFGTGTIPGGSLVNRWNKFDIIFDFTTSPRSVRWYQNGELFHIHENFDSSTAGVNEWFGFSEFAKSTGNPTYLYSPSFKGDLAKLDIYSKPLSSTEVKNNFTAFKSRFGL